MSRRRHNTEQVAHRAAWALHRLLSKLTHCPECGGVSSGAIDGIVHRGTCPVAGANREAQEWQAMQ